MKERKRYALVLFLFISIPMCTLVCMQLFQFVIKHEMKEKLENQMLQTVTLKKADVVWVKSNTEINLNGRMFDIKSMTEENDLIIFKGLFDDEETAIVKFVEKSSNNGTTNQQSSMSSYFQLFLTVYKSTSTIEYKNILKDIHCFRIENNLTIMKQLQQINIPPPKV